MHYLIAIGAIGVIYYAVFTARAPGSALVQLPSSLDDSQYVELNEVSHAPTKRSSLTEMKFPRDDTVLHTPGRSVSFGDVARR